jgi:hypothetical protein
MPRWLPNFMGRRVSRRGVDTWTAWTIHNLRGLGVDSGVDKRGRFVPRGAARQLGESLLAGLQGCNASGGIKARAKCRGY